MDDSQKRSLLIISLVVAAGLAVWYFVEGRKPNEPRPRTPTTASTSGQPLSPGRPAEPGQPERPGPAAPPGAPLELTEAQQLERTAQARELSIDTPQFHATFTNLNTGLVHYVLKGERFAKSAESGARTRTPMDLVTTRKEKWYPFRFDVGGVPIPRDAIWEAEQLSPTAIRFSWTGAGFTVARKIEAGRGPYQLWSTVRVTNTSAGARPVRVNLRTTHYVKRTEEGSSFFGLGARSPAISQGICLTENSTKRFDRKALLETHTYHQVGFAGTENTYFATLFATDRGTADFCTMKTSDRFTEAGGEDGSLFETRLAYPRQQLAPGATTVVRTLAYIGPKDGALLAGAGHNLADSVDLGFFSIIARLMVKLLGFIHDFTGNWGLAIILMTVCVKMVLFPLTLAQLRSMAKMRQLKPELDKLNEQYGDDREKKGAATMELYRRNGVNPVAGCLPSMAQLPIWWALYTSLSTNIALFNMPFLPFWLTDLSSPDPIYVMPLMLGALMWLQQRMTPTTMDPTQAKIMQWMMPIMITVFMLFLPQGLTLYMFTNSALGIAQQRFIEYRLGKVTAAAGVAPVTEVVAGAAGAGSTERNSSTGSGGKKTGKASARRTSRG